MLSSDIGIQILNGFLKSLSKTVLNFNIDTVYLGLLTKLPQNNEQPYEDGTYFSEPTDDEEYHRIQISGENPLEGKDYILGAQDDEVITKDGVSKQPAYITNQCAIMFPETSVDWGQVAGFGVFKEDSGTNLPLIWGEIKGADGTSAVEINAQEVPIIRANGFKVSLV